MVRLPAFHDRPLSKLLFLPVEDPEERLAPDDDPDPADPGWWSETDDVPAEGLDVWAAGRPEEGEGLAVADDDKEWK